MKTVLKIVLGCLLFVSTTNVAQTITKQQAVEDLEQFKSILVKQSSYLYSKGLNPDAEIEALKSNLSNPVEIQELFYGMMKIVGKIGDRHARVRLRGLKRDKLGLPFIMAPIDGKIVALKKEIKNKQYELFQKNLPYVSAINGMPMNEFIESIAWAYKYAPEYSKVHYVTRERNYNFLLTTVFGEADSYKFTFTDGIKNKTVELSLEKDPKRWRDQTYRPDLKDSASLFKTVGNNIGYMSIPAMISREGKYGNLYRYVDTKMYEYKDTDAIIIDLRNNGGGTREFLWQLAPYFLSPDAKPWVANVAKIRSDQLISEDMGSMRGRYLFNYYSEHLTGADREEIDVFMKNFKAEWEYDPTRFSDNFFMVLNHHLGEDHYYYDKPVYILVNERSFSAASVFTTAVKGMGKVQIAGICTDGSSGRSRKHDMNHSKINLKLSSMISMQRNGKTLDTNGTEPDIKIPKDLDQVLGKKDSQLEVLIKYIEEK